MTEANPATGGRIALHAAWLVVVVLAFVAGRWSTDGPPPPSSSDTSQVQQPLVEGESTRGLQRAAPTRGDAGTASPQGLESDSALPIETDTPPEGDGTISGRVTDDLGRPVPGVRVIAFLAPPSSWPRVDVEDPLEERIAGWARRERWQEATRSTATTDDDGRYVLEGLADGGHRLRGRLENWTIAVRGNANFQNARSGARVDFLARPISRLRVRFAGAPGAVERAAVRAGPIGAEWDLTWTRESPTLRVRPGRISVSAKAGEWGELRAAPVEIDVSHDGPASEVTLELAPVSGIGGYVRTEDAALGGAIWVVALAVERSVSEIEAGRLRDEGLRASTDVRENHRFGFLDLAPGRYAVGVGRDDEPAAQIRFVDVTDAFVRLDLELPSMERHEYVEVTVLAPNGRRLIDVTLALATRRGEQWKEHDVRPVLREGGQFWAPIPATLDRDADERVVIVRAPSVDVALAPFRADAAPTAIVRCAEPARLAVTIPNFASRSSAGLLQVYAYRFSGPARGSGPMCAVDGSGVARVPPLTPGHYDLSLHVSSRGNRHESITVAKRRVTLVSGTNALEFAVPELHRLTVVQAETSEMDTVWVNSPGVGTLIRQFGADRRAVFNNLPRGEYGVVSGGHSEVIQIPGRSEVRF